MKVLISGAGIAGSSLATLLAKTGASITVVEKAASLLPHGQNVDIQGAAVTAVQKMGLLEQVRKANTTEMGTRFVDTNGKQYGILPLQASSANASFTSEFEILRGDLAKILYEAADNNSNVNFLFGTTIGSVLSNTEDDVNVSFSNGKTEHFDLLILADGQWSKVRKQVFPVESVRVNDLGMYVAYCTVPAQPEDNRFWNIYVALRSRVVTTRPDPYGTIRAMFSIMPRNDEQKAAWQRASRSDRQTQEDLLKKEFTDAGWLSQRFLRDMSSAPDFYFQAIQQIKMDAWSEGRIICLGDTAYTPTPLTGMGTSLAIVGAYLLAGELSTINDGDHPRMALQAYEKSFRPFVEKMQKIPSFVPGIAHPETAFRRWLQRAFLTLLCKGVQLYSALPWLTDRFKQTNQENDDGFPLPSFPSLDEKLHHAIKAGEH
ncbi:hypothetical protein CBS101457_001356 [Exobasidium rhododendri]|nr:hypothetical protein CBS101457_001356 [Exobasidium rhododendri]